MESEPSEIIINSSLDIFLLTLFVYAGDLVMMCRGAASQSIQNVQLCFHLITNIDNVRQFICTNSLSVLMGRKASNQ